MKELLFFVLGLMTGGITGTTVMCCLQINKMSGGCYENERYKKAVLDKQNGSTRT